MRGAIGLRAYDHAVFGEARARGDEHATAFELDDTDPARVLRMQRLAEAQRGHIDAARTARVEQRLAWLERDGPAVDLDVRHRSRVPIRRARTFAVRCRSRRTPSGRGRRSRRRACIARPRRAAPA